MLLDVESSIFISISILKLKNFLMIISLMFSNLSKLDFRKYFLVLVLNFLSKMPPILNSPPSTLLFILLLLIKKLPSIFVIKNKWNLSSNCFNFNLLTISPYIVVSMSACCLVTNLIKKINHGLIVVSLSLSRSRSRSLVRDFLDDSFEGVGGSWPDGKDTRSSVGGDSV